MKKIITLLIAATMFTACSPTSMIKVNKSDKYQDQKTHLWTAGCWEEDVAEFKTQKRCGIAVDYNPTMDTYVMETDTSAWPMTVKACYIKWK